MSFSKVGACALTTLAYFCSPLAVEAAQLTYTPVNPSFGGNPGNSAHLLSVANWQNNYAPPAAPPASSSQTQATQFLQQLQSRFLSALASNVTEAIFGGNPQNSGEIVFGTVNEPRTLALEEAVQEASYDLVLEGVRLNGWSFGDKLAGAALLDKHLASSEVPRAQARAAVKRG